MISWVYSSLMIKLSQHNSAVTLVDNSWAFYHLRPVCSVGNRAHGSYDHSDPAVH